MSTLLGLDVQPRDLGFLQVCLRGIIVFFTTLVMVRLADKRFLSKLSAFDVILGFLLASMMARVVNGSAPFLPTFGGGFMLVFLHRLLAFISYHFDWFGRLIKGDACVVFENGRLNDKALKRLHVSHKDLAEELHLNGVDEMQKVKIARFERNGKISVIRKDAK